METHSSSVPRWIVVVGVLVIAGTADARQGASGERRRVVVDSRGAHIASELGPGSLTEPVMERSLPGLVWERVDGGEAWYAGAVSIGDRGYQVFDQYDLNHQSAEVLSCFDDDPPMPVWERDLPSDTDASRVASADATDTKVAISHVSLKGIPTERQAVLHKYGSSSATPDWTYTFEPFVEGGSHVGISRDGQTIVAAIDAGSLDEVHIAVFGPHSGVPLSYTEVAVGAIESLFGFDLSADGSTLVYSAGTIQHVFDVATREERFSIDIGAGFPSHAVSGDGSLIAFGNFNTLSVYERSGDTYVPAYGELVLGQCYCASVDISDDSSTVAAGWTFYDRYLKVRVDAIDMATKAVTMVNSVTGSGANQNVIADVSISADGKRFAVGVWGDAGGVVPECRIFARDSSVPLVSRDLPGSVYDCDISADGRRAVFGSKAVHANEFGNGGKVDLLTVGGEDLVLRGAPRVGSTVEFDLYLPPASHAFLMLARERAEPARVASTFGVSLLDPARFSVLDAGLVPPSGIATRSVAIPDLVALVGHTVYAQGASLAPRRFTRDWIRVTLLP